MNRKDLKPNIESSRYKLFPDIKDSNKSFVDSEDGYSCDNSSANKNGNKNTQVYVLPVNILEKFGLTASNQNKNCAKKGFSTSCDVSFNPNDEQKSSQREVRHDSGKVQHKIVDIQTFEIEKQKSESSNNVVNAEKCEKASHVSDVKNKLINKLNKNFASVENASDVETPNFEISTQGSEDEVKLQCHNEISVNASSSIENNILISTDVNDSHVLNCNEDLNRSNSSKSLEKQDSDCAVNKTNEIAEYLKTFLQSLRKFKSTDSDDSANNMHTKHESIVPEKEQFKVSSSDDYIYSTPIENSFKVDSTINDCIDTSLKESDTSETIHLFDDNVQEVIKHDLTLENKAHNVLQKNSNDDLLCTNRENISKKYSKSYIRNRNKNNCSKELLLTEKSNILNDSQENTSVNEIQQLNIIGNDISKDDVTIENFQTVEDIDESGLQLVVNEGDEIITYEDSLETLSQTSHSMDITTSIPDFDKEEYVESTEHERSLADESAQDNNKSLKMKPEKKYFDGMEESNVDSLSNLTSMSNSENEHLENNEISESQIVLNKPRKRGRPRKYPIKEDFGKKLQRCAVCSEELLLRDWPMHNMTFHNFLGWLNGEEPVNLKDKKLVYKLLQQKVKARKRLKCEKCSVSRLSADGFMAHLAVCQANKYGVVNVGNSYQCAVCSEEVSLREWSMHNMTFHNNLGWLNGEEPINLEDKKLVFKLLQQKIKAKKSLQCEKCSVVRMSADGFISHLDVCQKTEQEIKDSVMVACHICQNTMLPGSMKYHMRDVHGNEKLTKITSENLETKSKRKAAKLAEESFKKGKFEFANDGNCDRIDIIKTLIKRIPENEIPALLKTVKKRRKNNKQKDENLDANDSQHLNSNKSVIVLNVYTCTLCDYMDKFKYNTIKHISETHSQHIDNLTKPKVSCKEDASDSSDSSNIDDDDDDCHFTDVTSESVTDSDCDDLETKSEAKPKIRPRAFLNIRNDIKSQKFCINCAKKFVKNNYSDKIIFEELHCNTYQTIDESDIMTFLPEIQTSCNIACASLSDMEKDDKIQWKKYRLFESQLSDRALTLWCGGPVWSISWVPGQCDNQYLAVAVDNKMDERYFYNKVYEHNNLIQIWDVGFISNKEKFQSNADMVYSIAHNHGVIWDMEWCPSGCNDYNIFNQSNTNNVCHQKSDLIRLGLLCVACSNGKAYIYAMYHPSSLVQCKSKIYCTEPCVELCVSKNLEGTENLIFQATKISWSKNKNHEVIAVGYSNGFVALFDINTKSPLLRNKRKQTIYLYPYFVFQPYTDLINGLVIISKYTDNCTANDFLLGISSSQGCGIWNGINCLINKKGRYNYIFSSYPWPQIMTISDGLLSYKTSSSYMTGVTVLSTPFVENVEFAISGPGVMPIGGVGDINMYNNKIIAASYSGDVMLCPIRSPYFSVHKEAFINNKFIFSCARAVNLCEELSQVLNKKTQSTNKRISKKLLMKNDTCDTFSYEEVVQKYGLLFIDTHKKSEKIESADIQSCPPDRWPLQGILCVKTNPSLQANNFYAFGGRAGYVRILGPLFYDCK